MPVQHLSDNINNITSECFQLLKKLIETPSFSKTEDQTAKAIKFFFEKNEIECYSKLNNVWVKNKKFNPELPTILLNSHHDTVKPNSGYTLDPFKAIEKEGKLFGLGSNDAGGALVSLLGTFMFFYEQEGLKYNLIYAATAEEEISGINGVECILPELPPISFGIVGEPTELNIAIAEKGLLVIDCIAKGKSGHAAREEGENAIYKALEAIRWFQTFSFPKVSESLGEIKMTVTIINSGTQHNVVPDECRFTVDIRVTDVYTIDEVLEVIRHNVNVEILPRSVRLNPSSISKNHPVVLAGIELGKKIYGSPTTSDQALMSFPTLKCGPGDSARSHTADEFIYISEVEEGVKFYIQLLSKVIL